MINELFYDNLVKRFQKYDFFNITEDCVRYDYFASLLSYIDTSDILLEYSPQNNKNLGIDCVIKHPDKKLEAIEFKFFRSIPSKKQTNQTQQLGNFIKDFYKLKLFHEVDIRTVVIVTNDKMRNYINNKFALFSNIDNNYMKIKIQKNILDEQPKSFQENIMPYSNIDLNISRIFCKIIKAHDIEYVVSIFNIN